MTLELAHARVMKQLEEAELEAERARNAAAPVEAQSPTHS
jgi:hypothetical protein